MRTRFWRSPRSAHILSILIATILALHAVSAQAADSAAVEVVIAAINQARGQAGLVPLAVHPLLNQAAQVHVDDILANYTYSHRGSDGSWVEQRVARTGYAANPWVSENWVSSTSAAGAMNWWMNDYTHRVNILSSHWVEMGVGASSRSEGGEMVFVTVFSAGTGGAVMEAAAPPAADASNAAASVPAQGLDYAIQAGDTLMVIAARYGMDWRTLAAANGLGEYTVLQIGQVVHLPGVAAPAGGGGQAASAGAGAASGAYTVQPGDTLLGIALRYGIEWEELASLNGLSESSLLQIGQSLRVPGASQSATADASATAGVAGPAERYTIQAGDTIVGIAVRYNLDWQALLRLNGLGEDSILQLGQEIRLR